MELTPGRRAKLIVSKILEFAEVGGMEPEDCGVAYDAISNCLDEVCIREGDETMMQNLNDQIQQILRADNWDQ